MESSSLFPEARPRPNGINPQSKASENPVRDMPRPNGTNSKAMVDKPKAESTNSKAVPGSENPVRDVVSYGTKEKEKEQAPRVEEEEILELKTPGFIRVFGCDNCANDTSDTEDTRPSCSHHSSSEDDDDDAHHHHHQPPHLIPVVRLRVPMENEDDVRKVVAALQIKGVREVACDLENQIVKVSGTADPDRLLKKAKKVKRKSRLISYSNPREEIPPPSYAFHHQPQPPYSVPLTPRHYEEPPFHHHHRPPPAGASYDHHHRPPPPAAYYDHHHRPTTSAPPPAAAAAAAAAYYDHHHRPTTNVRAPPPPTPGYYDEFYRRAPSSPPHYGSTGYYPERSHHSTSPPRRRSYRSAPHFRPPPPPVVPGPVPLQQHYGGGRSWIPSAPYGMDDFHQVPHRSTMHMYH